MANGKRPLVSIGLPVYNGARFLPQTLDGLLAQTLGDFELIISDNGSTDATESICRAYAARDARIRYERHGTNRGAAWNYNRVFHLSAGEFFKWSADDDPCAPTYLEECVRALRSDGGAALAFTYTPQVDLEGKVIRDVPYEPGVRSRDTPVRFRSVICGADDCRPVFGLIRSDLLKKTALIAPFVDSDLVLLAQLSLSGHFLEIERPLQFRRIHPEGSERCFRGRRQERAAW